MTSLFSLRILITFPMERSSEQVKKTVETGKIAGVFYRADSKN